MSIDERAHDPDDEVYDFYICHVFPNKKCFCAFVCKDFQMSRTTPDVIATQGISRWNNHHVFIDVDILSKHEKSIVQKIDSCVQKRASQFVQQS